MATSIESEAIKKGDLDALTAALDAGIDPNARDGDGRALLMLAVFRNQLHIVDVLLSRGANVHQEDLFNGQTPLHLAAFTWRSDVFRRIFFEAGPRSMNFPDCDGRTPLHWLARYGSAEQMAFALSYPGIDISIQDDLGCTPLEVLTTPFRAALQTYGDQEARWQPMRYTWIKLLII
jgi:ankyrin repeat protein